MNPGDFWVIEDAERNGGLAIKDQRTGVMVALVKRSFDAIAIARVPQLLAALIPFARQELDAGRRPDEVRAIRAARAVLDAALPHRMVWPGDPRPTVEELAAVSRTRWCSKSALCTQVADHDGPCNDDLPF